MLFTKKSKLYNFWHNLGPGLTTGAADDDPSGIATYSQAGAQYGYKFLWLAPFTFPLMAIVQETCARIGLATGQGLAANIKKHYPRWVLYLCSSLLFIANTLNIGADIGAMAKATQLIINIPFIILIITFALVSILMQIFISYALFAKYLKWLTLVLFAYVFTAFIIKIDWQKATYSLLIPSFEWKKEYILLICAVLGTTISPYLFFWQTSQEVEERIQKGWKSILSRKKNVEESDYKTMRTDVWSGMALSNIVMFFIILTTAATLNQRGITDINSAEQAALALKPLAGDGAYLLFTLGIIGTGMLAIPVLAGSASYALSESFGWKEGLNLKFKQAQNFYIIIILSVIIGILINFSGINSIKALVYSSVLNGLIAPLILIMIVLISSNKSIMGKHKSSFIYQLLSWLIISIMILAGLATIYTIFQ